MIAYKGFNPGLICKNYQFEMGINRTMEANCIVNGFHWSLALQSYLTQ